jgi:hypothetical protein
MRGDVSGDDATDEAEIEHCRIRVDWNAAQVKQNASHTASAPTERQGQPAHDRHVSEVEAGPPPEVDEIEDSVTPQQVEHIARRAAKGRSETELRGGALEPNTGLNEDDRRDERGAPQRHQAERATPSASDGLPVDRRSKERGAGKMTAAAFLDEPFAPLIDEQPAGGTRNKPNHVQLLQRAILPAVSSAAARKHQSTRRHRAEIGTRRPAVE